MYEDFYLDTVFEDRYDCLGDEPMGDEVQDVCEGYDFDDGAFDDGAFDDGAFEGDGADAYALASSGFGTDEDYGGGEDSYLDSHW